MAVHLPHLPHASFAGACRRANRGGAAASLACTPRSSSSRVYNQGLPSSALHCDAVAHGRSVASRRALKQRWNKNSLGRRARVVFASTNETPGSKTPSPREVNQGRILLGVVGAFYGSLAAALRYVYLLPGPPSASALSAVRGVMAALCFVPFAWAWRKQWADLPREFWTAAFELALWNFLSQGLLNIALLYTDAMRVSFIAQTAIVLTPIIAALRGNSIGRITWLACVVALVGVALLAGDGTSAAAAAVAAGVAPPAFRITGGDALALGGAATSSLYIYRMSEFGKKGLSTDMTQAVKVILLGVLYSFWAIGDGMRIVAAGGSVVSLWPGYTSWLAWAVLLYSAIVPGAVADVMQARGQAKVDAAEAQVLLGAEPLWTAILGIVLLHERMGPQGCVGAGLIITAVLMAGGFAEAALNRLRGKGPAKRE